jgi:hypothetical protein
MLVSSKKNNNRKNSSFNDNVAIKKKQKNDEKICSFNNLTLIKDNQMKLMNQPKLCLNVIDFIKQKKKFFLENSFDVRGTREFLASKEVAMRVIKLNDEIIPQEEEKGRMSGNDNEKYEKKNKNIKLSGKRTISPRKSRKSHKKMNNNDFIIEQKEIMDKKSRKMKKSSKRTKSKISEIESKVDSSNLDSNSSNMSKDNNIIFDKISKNSPTKIYKFFIDNANEPDENFQKKLKKELKKVENLSQKKDKDKDKKSKIKRKSISREDLPYKRPKRLNSVIIPKNKETQSTFMFSEINKKLMINDDLSLSSIGEQNVNLTTNINNNKKKLKREYNTIQMNNKQIRERIHQKASKDIKDEKENIYKTASKMENSEKDSIISILSDLM